MAQLVGRNCIRCGERIADELESRFCGRCGSPVHDCCVHPSVVSGCPSCGAAVAIPDAAPVPIPAQFQNEKLKSELLAFSLNFFLPGAGLLYLGMRGWAVINLLVFLSIAAIFALALPDGVFDRNIGGIGAGLNGGDGGLAMALAKRRNQRL